MPSKEFDSGEIDRIALEVKRRLLSGELDADLQSLYTGTLNDNNDGQAWETLREIGYEQGDYLWMPVTRILTNQASTSSSSYVEYDTEVVDVVPDFVFPDSVDLHWQITYRLADPNGDQIDVRLREQSDFNTLAEQTGITTISQDGRVGPTQFNPPKRDAAGVRPTIQFRNSDGTTTVDLGDAHGWMGVQI